MPEKEPDLTQATYSETPDEIFAVDGYGARVTVNVWHFPVPKIKPAFKAIGGSVPDKPSGDTREIREQKFNSLITMARLVGYQALLRGIPNLKSESMIIEATDVETPLEDGLEDKVEKPISEPEPEVSQPEINHEPLLIESLKPGDILLPIKDVSELALFESFLASEIQPNGIWGEAEKWSIREPLKDLIKKFTINGAKFNGSVTSVQMEVMPNPASKLLEANQSKQEAKFIFSEKLPYKPSAKRIAAIKSGTIGFVATIDFTSTKGLYGTVQSELWYTKMDSRSIKDVNRYMTRPVIVELHESNTETSEPNASPVKRRWPMSELFQSQSSRRATLK